MTRSTPDRPTADHDAPVSYDWIHLEHDLVGWLMSAVGHDEPSRLVVELPGGGRHASVVLATNPSVKGLRGDIRGGGLAPEVAKMLPTLGWMSDGAHTWTTFRAADDHSPIVREMLLALRDGYGIPDPGLLTYRAWGPVADEAQDLGIQATETVTVEHQQDATVVHDVLTTADLRARLVDIVRELYETEPEVDDDGDVVLHHAGQRVWVGPIGDSLVVRVFARVVHGVYSRRAAATEIAILNRDHSLVRFDLRGRDVWLAVDLPSSPFVPDHLVGALAGVFAAIDRNRADLALRVRGREG
ncbi:T3SS (YopN, CesT) and YbjN peptide-binding chaperone 1 [Janibacter massiliensis]|uniref:T3SS (YopN, CesT) and YbjN peptide-binding chaperone 1 n=1 Tax=Janibacter massiliensis TaxID=2058291 RepID=UPI00131A5E50|nr:hypothetical protein [Janibacter massiliensis]